MSDRPGPDRRGESRATGSAVNLDVGQDWRETAALVNWEGSRAAALVNLGAGQ